MIGKLSFRVWIGLFLIASLGSQSIAELKLVEMNRERQKAPRSSYADLVYFKLLAEDKRIINVD